MQERKLTEEQSAAIRKNLASGMRLLAVKLSDHDRESPGKIMEALQDAVEEDSIFLPEAVAVLMDCLEKAVGWRPVLLAGEKFTGTAMVSPDGSHAIYPELVVGRAVRKSGERGLVVLFSNLVEGSLPLSTRDTCTLLG